MMRTVVGLLGLDAVQHHWCTETHVPSMRDVSGHKEAYQEAPEDGDSRQYEED